MYITLLFITITLHVRLNSNSSLTFVSTEVIWEHTVYLRVSLNVQFRDEAMNPKVHVQETTMAVSRVNGDHPIQAFFCRTSMQWTHRICIESVGMGRCELLWILLKTTRLRWVPAALIYLKISRCLRIFFHLHYI